MGEFAVGPVDLTPLLEQGQDLGCLLGQDPVHREPARRLVGQPAAGPAGVPAVGADLADLKRPAGAADTPAGIHGPVDEIEQPCLGGRIHPARDSATQPQPPFPLYQRQLHRQFLAGLREPGDLGLRGLQLVIALPALHSGFGGRQRRQGTVLGDLLDPHDRGPVDLLGSRDLGDRGLLPHQLQPDLVLQRRAQEPLRTALPRPADGLVLGHLLILLLWLEDPPDVV